MTNNHEGAAFAHLSDEERIKKVNSIRIMHPRFSQVMNAIQECHQMSKLTADPKCLLVTGQPGSGKTTSYNMYAKQYGKVYDTEDRTVRTILSAILPSPTTIKSLIEKMLVTLGDPKPNAGKTIGERTNRLVNLIKECGVELIMFDEFQNFIDPNKKKIFFDVSEWFKTLINETRVPVVLFGLDYSQVVLDQNPQLDRRFQRRIQLDLFNYKKKSDKQGFQKLMEEIDKRLPFTNLSGLSEPEFCAKMHAATGGLMYSIMALVRDASVLAIEEGVQQIEMEHFEQAFLTNHFINRDKINPFVEDDEYDDE